jgi:hypothetical protein
MANSIFAVLIFTVEKKDFLKVKRQKEENVKSGLKK